MPASGPHYGRCAREGGGTGASATVGAGSTEQQIRSDQTGEHNFLGTRSKACRSIVARSVRSAGPTRLVLWVAVHRLTSQMYVCRPPAASFRAISASFGSKNSKIAQKLPALPKRPIFAMRVPTSQLATYYVSAWRSTIQVVPALRYVCLVLRHGFVVSRWWG